MNRHIKINKYILIILAVLLVSALIVPMSSSFARDQEPVKLNTQFKLSFLTTPAYYCMKVSSIPLLNKKCIGSPYPSEINSYANLNDTEFKTMVSNYGW